MSEQKMNIKSFWSKVKSYWADTYTKRLVSVLILNSILWIWASFILAFLGRDEIAEDLASKIVVTILGTVITYCIKSFGENVAQKGYKGKTVAEPDEDDLPAPDIPRDF